MSCLSTATTTGSAYACAASVRMPATTNNVTSAFMSELHRRTGAAGESCDRLVARRITDAPRDAYARRDFAAEVVIEPHAGIAMRRRQVRDLDRCCHRPARDRAPTESEEPIRADVGEVLDTERDVTRLARTESRFTAPADGEALRRRHHDHAAVESHALGRGQAQLEPARDSDAGLQRAPGHRIGAHADLIERRARVAEQTRVTDADLFERVREQFVREVGVEPVVLVLDAEAFAQLDPFAHGVDARLAMLGAQ